MTRDLASQSSTGQLRIALEIGHGIMLDAPVVVIEVVHDASTEALTSEQK